ncbi:fibrinogen-like protein 1 [Saccostrea echinata]|uniref:fibrinogen-like protein 1 n=1 Tax=Saccostrea echinata TaxID=191078 RepID=UPI002A835D81|nr:fibrinogen-like protein 1 [Saccostrea echinata]
MDAYGGGWTVIQHRNRGYSRINFKTTWSEYKRSFGDVRGNYWLADGYRLSLGEKSGSIGDAFRSWHPVVNYPFYTFDHDNENGCAAQCRSGWWYNHCTLVHLNAPFLKGIGIMYGMELFQEAMIFSFRRC